MVWDRKIRSPAEIPGGGVATRLSEEQAQQLRDKLARDHPCVYRKPFLSLAIGADIIGRHQLGIVTKRCEFAAQVMCADAGFHADQARRHIGEPRFHLATRPLLPQHDSAARIVTHDVERVLADIDPDHGDCGIGNLRNGVLLVLAPMASLSLAGQEHGRTTPPVKHTAHGFPSPRGLIVKFLRRWIVQRRRRDPKTSVNRL